MSVSFGSIQSLLPAYCRQFDQSSSSMGREETNRQGSDPSDDHSIYRILSIYEILPRVRSGHQVNANQ